MTSPGTSVGLLASGWHDPEQSAKRQVDMLLERIQFAGEQGFTSVWVGEHFMARPWPVFQAVPFLAHIMGRAQMQQYGFVALLPFRHPVAFAETVTTLDALSEGRLAVAPALGWRAEEFAMFGIERRDRVARFEEYLAVVTRLLSDEGSITFEGRYVQLEDVRMIARPTQGHRPPFWIGASSVKAVERAARLSDAWLGSAHTPFDQLESLVPAYLAALHAAGRSVPAARPIFRHCYVAETHEQAILEAGPSLLSYYGALGEWGLFKDVIRDRDFMQNVEETAQGRVILGTPDECVEEFARYQHLGFDHFVLQIGLPGMDQDRVLRALELIGRDVLPRISNVERLGAERQ